MSSSPRPALSVSTAHGEVQELGAWRVASVLPPGDREAVMVRQVHGGTIAAARAVQSDTQADGIYVAEPGVRAAIGTADCMPVVLLSDQAAVVLHVSRRTLIYGLLENAFSYLPAQLVNRVCVGPHICEYHFSFEREEAELRRFRVRYPRAVHFHHGRLHVSLKAALESVLDAWDIDRRRVVYDGRCTLEHDELPSYRRLRLQGGLVQPLPVLQTVVWRAA